MAFLAARRRDCLFPRWSSTSPADLPSRHSPRLILFSFPRSSSTTKAGICCDGFNLRMKMWSRSHCTVTYCNFQFLQMTSIQNMQKAQLQTIPSDIYWKSLSQCANVLKAEPLKGCHTSNFVNASFLLSFIESKQLLNNWSFESNLKIVPVGIHGTPSPSI